MVGKGRFLGRRFFFCYYGCWGFWYWRRLELGCFSGFRIESKIGENRSILGVYKFLSLGCDLFRELGVNMKSCWSCFLNVFGFKVFVGNWVVSGFNGYI